MLPVHDGAEHLPGESFQLGSGSLLEFDLPDVTADIESAVVLPAWKPQAERSRHDAFEIARKKRKLGLDEMNAIFKRDLALKGTHAGDIERHVLAFEMQENGIAPGKAIALGMIAHDPSLCLANENRCASLTSFSVL